MKTLSFSSGLHRVLFLASGIILGSGIHAAPVNLADAPLGSTRTNTAPPAIVMTADDSGSMFRTYMPDDLDQVNYACLVSGSLNNINPQVYDASGHLITDIYGWTLIQAPVTFQNASGISYTSPGIPYIGFSDLSNVRGGCMMTPATRTMSGTTPTGDYISPQESLCQNQQPPMLASAFNGVAYNPLIDYSPPPGYTSFSTPASWKNVYWNVSTWIEGQGRPVSVDLTANKCAYTTQQYNDLTNYYMYNGSTSVLGTAHSAPLNYYRTSVKWCNALRSTGNSFNYSANPGSITLSPDGTVIMSNCQNDRYDPGSSAAASARYIYPYFYSYRGENDTIKADNTRTPAFELVVLDPVAQTVNGSSSISHVYYDSTVGAYVMKPHINPASGKPDGAAYTRTAQEEIANYANWAAYFRNRMAATKASAALAFDKAIPDPSTTVIPRVGYNTINNIGFTLANFAGTTNRTNFFNSIYAAFPGGGSTPLKWALWTMGDKFLKNGNGEIQYDCQRSNVILFTDGLWNDPVDSSHPIPPTGASTINNTDGSPIGTLPDSNVNSKSVYAVYGGGSLAAANNWPYPIREGAGSNSASQTMADIALYYWKTRLGGFTTNNVLPTGRDPATWPHLNFYGMGFGVKGTLPSSDQTATLSRINGTATTTPLTYAWPAPAANMVSAVDDLWHAAVNGFGRYVPASGVQDFQSGLLSILNEILNISGTRSGKGFTSQDLTVGNQYTYTPSFAAGWSGDIVKRSIDSSGIEYVIPGQKSAAENLQVLLTPTGTPPNIPWRDVRQVFTTVWSGGSLGVGTMTPAPFSASSSSAFANSSLMATLGASPAQQANVIAYLRGNRSKEGDDLGKFRVRGTGPLGDIVDAKPVVITVPYCSQDPNTSIISCDYNDIKNVGYQAFYTSNKNRKTMIYAGANDGMLHAFDENLNEKWAYIPSDLFRQQSQAGIVDLSFQESDLNTPFTHYFYANATPRATDVFLGDTNTWETVLVGGLGKGGTSYYALKVTDDKGQTSEGATATQKVMWEFTNGNMGYSFGRPVIAKTGYAVSDWGYDDLAGARIGKWMTILPSGYNNGTGSGQPKSGNGKGYIYFVDTYSGKWLKEIPTPANDGATAATPLGLAAIGGYTETPDDQLATAVYGGDQQGNFWRFNLEDTADLNNWTVSKMADLHDKSGNKQWVTTEPWPQLDNRNNRWVFVGTGGFRSDSDLFSTVQNTFYAYRDGTKKNADIFGGSNSRSRADLEPVSGLYNTNSTTPSRLTDYGWYEDLPVSTSPNEGGYHITVNPVWSDGVIVYAANKFVGGLPGGSGSQLGNLCDSALFTGRIYARDMQTAQSVLQDTGGTVQPYIEVAGGIADIVLVDYKDPSGKGEIGIYVTGMTGGGGGGGGGGDGIKGRFPPQANVGGSNVPIRTNIRFINMNR